jgi:alkaline phosphatase D
LPKPSQPDRRRFLKGAAVAAVAPAILSCEPEPAFETDQDIFPLGVGSGDPDHESVVLWTRLAIDPLNGGGMPVHAIPVVWEMSRSPSMNQIVASGVSAALPTNAHSVHAVATGLEPNRWYWYRFTAAGQQSRVGRTRTFPHPNSSPDRMRFALVSCQNYEDGFYPTYRDMNEQGLDFIVHVGDYIYENGASINPIDPARRHLGGEAFTIDEYRNRYALYRLDPDLQDAHAHYPFIVTWDDHEVDNNYAGLEAEENAAYQGGEFVTRRRNAYRAYAEAMPLRPENRFLRGADELRIYRTLRYGDLASFHILDTRQYKSDQPTFDGLGSTDPDISAADVQLLESILGELVFDRAEILDPDRSMLGLEQEAWLARQLTESNAHWNVMAQQVMVMPWNLVRLFGLQINFDQSLPPATRAAANLAISQVDDILNMDGWDGAQAARQRFQQLLAGARPNNPVVLTGDVHSAWGSHVFEDYADPTSDVVAAEFVCTGLSSAFRDRDPRSIDGAVRLSLFDNPHVEFFNALFRGYCICEVDRQTWRTEYRAVGTMADLASASPDALIPMPGSAVETDAVLSIESGFNEPGSSARLVTEFARVPAR